MVRTPGLQSGGPGNKHSTLPLTGLFLNGSLNSIPWLCFVYSQLRLASCQFGFLQPMSIYNVWDQIFHTDPKMSLVEGDLSVLQVYKDIPTDTYLIIIIKYNRLNKTYQS